MQYLPIPTLLLLSKAPLLFLFPDDKWFSWQHKSFLQGMLKTLPSPFRISDKCRGDIHREQNIWSARCLGSITLLPSYHLISSELHYKPRQVHHRWLSRELADKGFLHQFKQYSRPILISLIFLFLLKYFNLEDRHNVILLENFPFRRELSVSIESAALSAILVLQ